MIVVVTASVRSSSPLVSVIVCAVLNRLPKVIVGPTPVTRLVSAMAWRSVPAPLSAVLTTRALKAPGLVTEIDVLAMLPLTCRRPPVTVVVPV